MTIRNTVNRIAVLSALLAGFALPAAAAVPEGVSPGSLHRLAPVEVRCPTFNWGMVPGTAHYEVVAYVLPAPEEVTAEVELQLSDDAEVLYATVPGSATGWTPSADMCLAPGGRYVWFVRSIAATENGETTEAGDWSEGLFFTVMNLPSRDQAWDLPVSGSDTADRLERRGRGADKGPLDDPWVLVSGDVMTGPLGVEADGVNIVSQVTRNDELTGNVTKLEVRSERGTPLLTVDSEGDVKAASFSGGPVDADRLSVGGSTVVDADGDWVGNGDTLPCVGCVATADLADDSVTTSKIANGAVKTADLHDNCVASTKILDGTITADDISPSGGVYSSRNAIYMVVDERILNPGGMIQYHALCNDANDLPLGGGCHAPFGALENGVNLSDSFPLAWHDPSVPAGYGCSFENRHTSAHEVSAIVYCIDVP